jgi:hypothetical protein
MAACVLGLSRQAHSPFLDRVKITTVCITVAGMFYCSCLLLQSGFPLWSSVHGHRDDVTFIVIDSKREAAISGSFDRDIRCWDLRVCLLYDSLKIPPFIAHLRVGGYCGCLHLRGTTDGADSMVDRRQYGCHRRGSARTRGFSEIRARHALYVDKPLFVCLSLVLLTDS